MDGRWSWFGCCREGETNKEGLMAWGVTRRWEDMGTRRFEGRLSWAYCVDWGHCLGVRVNYTRTQQFVEEWEISCWGWNHWVRGREGVVVSWVIEGECHWW